MELFSGRFQDFTTMIFKEQSRCYGLRVRVLTGGNATVTQTSEGTIVTVPQAHRQEIDTIVVLELDRPFGETAPRGRISGSLTAFKAAL